MIESKYLKDDLKNIEQLSIIPAFKNLHIRKIAALLKLSKIRQYENGECIIKEEEQDIWLYFLLSGKVRIESKTITICTIDKTGELFGEMRFTDGHSRSASVFAEGKTICLAVDTLAKSRLSSDEEAAGLIALLFKIISRNLSLRLRSSNEELIRTKKELAELKNISQPLLDQNPR